jgi:UDP-N-acetylglucosamine--N-acetylmuramyl-(pentapeptide) pyrophosphoryl-undecaprenol N-acetylglucosamine transferase
MSLPRHDELRVIISGGGTGGHIFPAVSIAKALKEADSSTEILFVGAEGRMEMEKVPAAGFKIVGLPIRGIQRSLSVSNLTLPWKVLQSLLKARKIIREFRPDVAVGVGGYASGPLLFMATRMGIPALIQEQNSFAGLTNRWLAKRVNKICVAYEGMEKYFPSDKILLTGNPVRPDIQYIEGKRAEALQFFGLSPDKPVLLAIGGSLGARTINETLENDLERLAGAKVQLIWQTGKSFFSRAQACAKQFEQQGIKAFDFIARMDLAYAAADLVVSRAGASSVSELTLTGKAAILVPSPNVAEDHQTKNAMALVKHDAAVLVRDQDARESLVREALTLLSDGERRRLLSERIAVLALPDAAKRIAAEVKSIASKGS